jgi:hypothetical protein
MPIIRSGWDIDINVEDVLFAQAADAAVLSRRSPRLVEVAQKAAKDALDYLSPLVVYQDMEVKAFHRGGVILAEDHFLSGLLINEHLKGAHSVIVIVCTIGDALERKASQLSDQDIVYGYALDSAGSAAVDLLAYQAFHYFEGQKEKQGWKTSIAINPGMLGWPLKEGQKQIFSILGNQDHHVKLTESGLMIPLKSISMVIGAGPDMERNGNTCDYCSFKGRCYYQKNPDLA